MSSFVDEYAKIAASVKAAPGPKSRKGKRPIRVDNLLKKANAPVQIVEAVAPAASSGLKGLLSALWQRRKPIALVGGGAAGMKILEEKAIEPMELGYQMQRQYGK